ncbi:MAG TPA: hypothetical protein DDW76_10345 [Cyanobacteria bacterium UBA11369]|nr:hypothetical protein [Cyanobacteria bacterium UBA11371]HBE17345.1 hypothetical protein [Cyanobacteria bacterium UBA11367]HBE30530.1 hypothetical protein [Cyanobacteria bacterium UBA11368]HBE49171.1 hypothetical protein [Cyanobacteria bacterium UBA11369]
MTSQAIPTNPDRLFITFLSPALFSSNPVRSFLQHLQKSAPFRFVNFPKNLYTASETLTEDYQPLTLSLQLPNGTQHPVVIAITPTQNNSAMLTLELGGADVARQLIGEEGNNTSIVWLTDIMATGARMTRADCAFISLEAQPNQTSKVRVELGKLYLEKLPIILWTTASLSEDISYLTADAWKAEQQSDGALLLIPKPLPESGFSEDKRSLWIDSTQTRYFLIPDRQAIPSGKFSLRNLDGDQKEVELSAITSFEITEEEAKEYLQAEINQAVEQAKNAFSNLINFSLQKPPETTPSSEKPQTTIFELIAALLGATPEELQNHPESVQAGLQNLLTEFKEVIGGSLSQDSAQLNIARQRMRSWQATLKAHGVDIGETLEQFPDKLHDLHFSSEPTPYLHQMTAKLRKFADKIDQSTADKGQSLGDAMVAFVNSYRELFGKEDEAQQKEKRQQEYKQMAEDAIARSLSDFKMPSFDFQDLLPRTNEKPEDEQK